MKKILLLVLVLGLFIKNSGKKEETEQRGIFISYIELKEILEKKTGQEQKQEIKKMIKNVKEIKGNMIILQVRANQDALYRSGIFPYMISSNEDLLSIFIEESHQENIKVIAWINPYRVSTTNKEIEEDSPLYQYKDTDVFYRGQGVFLNPAKKETEDLIINGVKEILEYEVDGILMDDYFYPSDDIDKEEYEDYKNNYTNISLQEYHYQVINQMIRKVHSICKQKNVKFGISPDGNINNNLTKHYADIKTWLKEKDYVDFIMPQLYYGFYNSTQGYVKVLKEWESLVKNDDIQFYVALAFYKVGVEDNYANAGRKEWLENDDIMMREILLSRNTKNYKGYALFRYNYIFNNTLFTNNTEKELENMKKVIK